MPVRQEYKLAHHLGFINLNPSLKDKQKSELQRQIKELYRPGR
jgi:hypothetical protein